MNPLKAEAATNRILNKIRESVGYYVAVITIKTAVRFDMMYGID